MSTAKELKELAKQRGIKYFSIMSKKKLCEELGIELPQKPAKITFKNTVTKEYSISQHSNSSSID